MRDDPREAFGRRAPDLFGALYGTAAQAGRFVAFDLDGWRTPSGTWKDLFVDAPWRLLDLPLWLLEDLAVAAPREALEADLLDAGALVAVAILVNEALVGAEGGDGLQARLLIGALVSGATWRLARVAGSADLLALDQAHWEAHAAALIHLGRWQSLWPPGPAPALDEATLVAWGQRLAPLKTVTAAALSAAGRPDLVSSVMPLLDRSAGLLQIVRQLVDVGRDLARGHWSEPVARLAFALGMTPDVEAPPPIGAVRLSLLVSRALPDLAAAGLEQARALRADYQALGLHRAGASTAGLETAFRDLLAVSGAPIASTDETVGFAVESRPRLEVALEAARGHLDIDMEGREAWEEYRHAFLGQSHLTASVFPLATIVENRILAGESLPGAVDDLLERYAANRFHYFDQPTCLPFDADSFGLMARLSRHASRPDEARALLSTPLRWILHNVQPDGEVPVFMTHGVDAGDGRRYIRTLGSRCATVQASLTLGLMDLGTAEDAVVDQMARWLLVAVATEGAAAFSYYDTAFSALLTLEVARRVRTDGGGRRWDTAGRVAEAAEHRLVELLQRRIAVGARHPLEAAALWLATGDAASAAHPLCRREWITWLLQVQRTNGSWDPSPFYLQPTRGAHVEWYCSRLLTTSFAYRALAHFRGAAHG